MKLPNHLFIAGDDNLYDTRIDGWHKLPPLRANYCATKSRIRTVADFKATLRNGAYAWPGGYPMYFIVSDGEALSFAAAREQFREVVQAIQAHDNSGWRVIATDINYEDSELRCVHSGERIESAYAEDDACEPE